MNSHNGNSLKYIKKELEKRGVIEYRFCVENDCYVCDKFGNFYSVCRRQNSKSGNFIEKYRIVHLTGSIDKYGYTTYRVVVDGIRKHLKAHRMMMNAWAGEKPHMSVNHLDGNKANNSLINLEWCTVAENNAHALATGLLNPRKRRYKYKVSTFDWISIYILNQHLGYSYSELGRMNKCKHDTIKAIIDRVQRVLPKEVLNAR